MSFGATILTVLGIVVAMFAVGICVNAVQQFEEKRKRGKNWGNDER